ncbi:MAG: galactonate dehydratase [Chloroflexi bacterium]|nr:galactonate dehydratase [Chloroflexota bacterium]
MRITDIQTYIVWGGAKDPNVRKNFADKNFCFVVVDTDEGIYGVGEAGLSSRELAVQGAVEHLKQFLIGRDPFQIERLWQEMFRGAFFAAGNVTTSAIAAIDIALWDIKGKALGVPVYELLGGLARDRVLCYGHIRGATPEALVEAARGCVDDGWKVLRWSMSVFPGPIYEPREAVGKVLAQFEALRNEFGPSLELIHDMHQRLDPPEAIELCRAAEPYRPFFMEDPVRAEGISTLRLVRQHVSVPIAVGEQLAHKWEFKDVIAEQLTDYARVDVCIAGGITETRKIANWAEAYYIRLATHNPLGPVSAAACLQVNLATANVGIQEQPVRPDRLLPDVVSVAIDWQDGYLLPTTIPGLGVEFDREAARKSPYRPHETPHLTRIDGSVTNW